MQCHIRAGIGTLRICGAALCLLLAVSLAFEATTAQAQNQSQNLLLPSPNPMRGGVANQPEPLALPVRRPGLRPARDAVAAPVANPDAAASAAGPDPQKLVAEAEDRYRKAVAELRAAEQELRGAKRERRLAARQDRRRDRRNRAALADRREGSVPPKPAAAAADRPAAGSARRKAAARQPEQAGNRSAGTSAGAEGAGLEGAGAVADLPADLPAKPAIATGWSKEEVAAARAECAQLLKGSGAVYDEQKPIREGRCGTPAPIRLRRIGTKVPVRLDPPAIMNCQLAATLGRWLEQDLQPIARGRLAGEIVGISNASSYSCRNRYNDANARLSEHALANAIDISEFKFRDGARVSVLADWGETRRDSERRLAQQAEAAAAAAGPQDGDAGEGGDTPQPANAVIADQTAAANAAREVPAGRLIGPGVEMTGFLRDAHRAACARFGTVLGPEANDAHRDHFHFDLAPRKRSNYCE